MGKVRVAIVGVGNCASSLLQGIAHYREREPESSIGLMHWEIGGYRPQDIEVVAAFDIDERKVGRDVAEAVFAEPNCTTVFCDALPASGVGVRMGVCLDGVPEHMASYPAGRAFRVSRQPEATPEEIVGELRESAAEVLVLYLPAGAEQAARLYARCALDAGVALVNCVPVFLASDAETVARFEAAGLPIIGDDVKSQLGATIVHRALTDLFRKRGVVMDRTYQLNTGGNTDFLNMLDRSRLASKKTSKTEAVQAVAAKRLPDENIHVGPSDYVAWQRDRKTCFIRIEGRLFGDVPMDLELRLSVEDSPNSAGVAIEAIRCAKMALDRGVGGPLLSPSAFLMKHPPLQMTDDRAFERIEEFIGGQRER